MGIVVVGVVVVGIVVAGVVVGVVVVGVGNGICNGTGKSTGNMIGGCQSLSSESISSPNWLWLVVGGSVVVVVVVGVVVVGGGGGVFCSDAGGNESNGSGSDSSLWCVGVRSGVVA